MMVLKINIKSFMDEFIDMLENLCTEILTMFFADATSGMSDKAKSSSKIKEISLEQSYYIKGIMQFKAQAIMESFGTGMKIDFKSSYLKDYINSDLFNPSRNKHGHFLKITGRPRGKYINIYGDEVTSQGKMEGKPVRVREYKATGGIQKAEAWMRVKNGKIDRRLQTEVKMFLSNKASKFIYNEGT